MDGPPGLTRQVTEGNIGVGGDDDMGLGDAPPLAAAAAGGGGEAGAAPPAGPSPYSLKVGGVTDPGVQGKQNQDDFFFTDLGGGNLVMGVLDGHGRELGKLAANTATASFKQSLDSMEKILKVAATPEAEFNRIFQKAHDDVRQAFTHFYSGKGWIVEAQARGYLTRRRSPGSPAQCIHGGTTASILIVYGGRKALIANVGDSTSLFCGANSESLPVRPIASWTGLEGSASAVPKGALGPSPHAFVEMTADHGPESLEEYNRMRKECGTAGGRAPELLFVYDALSSSKLGCPPIFHYDRASNSYVKTGRGSYYKNVRNEWATLVATPPHADFQDALAFTRSIGDLHLQTYGVSHVPEVAWMDFSTGDGEPLFSAPVAIVLCTDGVWDNWKFEEVAAFALNPAYTGSADAQPPTQALMDANLVRARRNFGSSADNMTAVCCYMTPVA